jgi:hypothetical protein
MQPMNHENPFEERPPIERIQIAGVEFRLGGRVRICPAETMDILDMALRGKTATIASIEQDFEDRIHLALTVDDDPGNDFGQAGLPGHRFFFRPADVVPLDSCQEETR